MPIRGIVFDILFATKMPPLRGLFFYDPIGYSMSHRHGDPAALRGLFFYDPIGYSMSHRIATATLRRGDPSARRTPRVTRGKRRARLPE